MQAAPILWRLPRRELVYSGRGTVMGIVNVTPDSFSDGGRYQEFDAAVEHGLRLIQEGAEILDIGGESTRPGADPVNAADEMARVLPVIERLRKLAPEVVISVDTSKAEVAEAACELGAEIINDITALRGDPRMADVAAKTGAGLILMHMQGTPRTMQQDPHYEDVTAEVSAFLAAQMQVALAAGVEEARIALDPGLGFGKTPMHNLQLLRTLSGLGARGRPVVLGVSRKSFFSKVLGATLEERDAATLAVTTYAHLAGAQIHRVHDVRPNVLALRMMEAIQRAE